MGVSSQQWCCCALLSPGASLYSEIPVVGPLPSVYRRAGKGLCRALCQGNAGLGPSGRNYQKSCLSAASTQRKGWDFTPFASPRIKTRKARRFITHKSHRITTAPWTETCLRECSLTGMQGQSSLDKITLEHGKWSRFLAGLNNGISKCLV